LGSFATKCSIKNSAPKVFPSPFFSPANCVPFVWPRNKTSSEKKNGKKRVELKASADYERMLSLPGKASVEKHSERETSKV
jgi:hypothetical protein